MFRKLMLFELIPAHLNDRHGFSKSVVFFIPYEVIRGFPPNFYTPLIQSKMKSAQNVHILFDNFNVYKKRSVEW